MFRDAAGLAVRQHGETLEQCPQIRVDRNAAEERERLQYVPIVSIAPSRRGAVISRPRLFRSVAVTLPTHAIVTRRGSPSPNPLTELSNWSAFGIAGTIVYF